MRSPVAELVSVDPRDTDGSERGKEAKSQEVRDSVDVEMYKRAKSRMKKDGPSSTDDSVSGHATVVKRGHTSGWI